MGKDSSKNMPQINSFFSGYHFIDYFLGYYNK